MIRFLKYTALFLALLVLTAVTGCNLPGPGDEAPAPVVEETFAAFQEGQGMAHEQQNMILMGVDTDDKDKIIRVSLLLPQRLMGKNIYVDDVLLLSPAAGEEKVMFELTAGTSADAVNVVVKDGGQPLALCTIRSADLTAPEGDCNW
jgi:hypothetical protein